MIGARPATGEREAGAPLPARVDFGYPLLRVRRRRFSWRLPVRVVVTSAALLALALALALGSLALGDFPLSITEVVAALTGGGGAPARLVVLEWRLPIALAALLFGALLGAGGAIFQSLTRNPLGSPDVIGFDAGSYTGVVIALLVLRTSDYWSLAAAAVLGGVATAVVVALLVGRHGLQGFRLIVVGIGVAAMLTAVNSYLVTRAAVQDALTIGLWGAGTLGRVSWDSMVPASVATAVVLGAVAALAPSLRRLELGDDAALAHGTRVGAARLALIAVGVCTTALVTAAAGPLAFVALVAPQLARRVTRESGAGLLGAAAMGALVLSAAQLLSLALTAVHHPVPVGLVTVCFGGLFLIHLLLREARLPRTR